MREETTRGGGGNENLWPDALALNGFFAFVGNPSSRKKQKEQERKRDQERERDTQRDKKRDRQRQTRGKQERICLLCAVQSATETFGLRLLGLYESFSWRID